MKKTILRKTVCGLLLCTVMVFCFVWQGSIAATAQRLLPHAVEYRARDGLGVTFDDISLVNSSQSELRLSGATRRDGILSSEIAPNETERVTVMLTDSGFASAASFDLFLGSYFSVSSIREENRVISLSDTLAVRFFGTHDVVGKTISLDGTSYLIGGIYRTDHSLLSRLSSDGTDIVCIPYTDAANQDLRPNILLARSSGSIRFLGNVTSQITSVTGKALMEDQVSNLTDIVRMVGESRGVTIFLCGLVLIAALLVLFVKLAKRAFAEWRQEEVNRREAIRFTVLSLLVLLAATAVFLLSKYPLYLPPSVLPNDNLFDWKHYLDQIVAAYQAKNALAFYDFYWELSFHSMVLSAFSALCAFASFLLAFGYLLRFGRWLFPQLDFTRLRDSLLRDWRAK